MAVTRRAASSSWPPRGSSNKVSAVRVSSQTRMLLHTELVVEFIFWRILTRRSSQWGSQPISSSCKAPWESSLKWIKPFFCGNVGKQSRISVKNAKTMCLLPIMLSPLPSSFQLWSLHSSHLTNLWRVACSSSSPRAWRPGSSHTTWRFF